MDRLSLWQTFVRVVEAGSFSAVARESGVGQPQVSKQMALLEAQMGVRLLRRSTRALTLTDEGERLYERAKRILDEVGQMEAQVRGGDVPHGLLRVACPTAFSRIKLLPVLTPFLERYPELQLELSVGDRFVDLVEEGVDVAVRIGELQERDFRARRIGSVSRVCVAAPAYLERAGTPATPADLAHHQCVLFTLLATGAVWPFAGMAVKVGGRVRGNSADVVRAFVIDGLGIGLSPSWLFSDAIADGRVRVLLADWPTPDLPLHAVYQQRHYLPTRVQVFVEYLAQTFAQDAELRIRSAPPVPDAATAQLRGSVPAAPTRRRADQ